MCRDQGPQWPDVEYTEEDYADPFGEKYLQKICEQYADEPPPDIVEPPIVKRDAWGAVAPKETSDIHTPVQAVFFTHTGSDMCYSKEECIPWLRARQKQDMEEEEMADIQYNFYIGGDGTVYEGRGWKHNATKTDDEAESMEGLSLDVAYIGDYDDKLIPEALVEVGAELIRYARKANIMHLHYGINSYWEDHVYALWTKPNSYNPLDDPEWIQLHKDANIPL